VLPVHPTEENLEGGADAVDLHLAVNPTLLALDAVYDFGDVVEVALDLLLDLKLVLSNLMKIVLYALVCRKVLFFFNGGLAVDACHLLDLLKQGEGQNSLIGISDIELLLQDARTGKVDRPQEYGVVVDQVFDPLRVIADLREVDGVVRELKSGVFLEINEELGQVRVD